MDDLLFANSISSSIISITGNIILTYLVAKYTSIELRPYKKILIIQIAFDITYSIIGPLSKYSRQLHNGILYYLFSKTNFGILLPLQPAAVFATLGFFFTNAIENILPLHFIYRYLLICHNKTLGYFLLFIVAFFCLLPATSIGLAFLLTFWPDESYEIYKELLRNKSFQSGDIPLFLATKFELASKYSFLAIVFSAVNYTVIAISASLLILYFRKNKSIMSPKTLQIQKQFNKMLFIEAAMPFITSFIPQILNYFGTWLNVSIFSFGQTFMQFVMPWTAAFNPVITIYVIITYRRHFLQKFLCRTNGIYDSSNQNGDNVSRSATIPAILVNK